MRWSFFSTLKGKKGALCLASVCQAELFLRIKPYLKSTAKTKELLSAIEVFSNTPLKDDGAKNVSVLVTELNSLLVGHRSSIKQQVAIELHNWLLQYVLQQLNDIKPPRYEATILDQDDEDESKEVPENPWRLLLMLLCEISNIFFAHQVSDKYETEAADEVKKHFERVIGSETFQVAERFDKVLQVGKLELLRNSGEISAEECDEGVNKLFSI